MHSRHSLIFLHIPKTGGMSFSPIIVRQFPQEAVYQINGSLRVSAEELCSLSGERKANIQCPYGHMPFGLHTCLSQPSVYVTLLRNPVERIISAYYYSLRRPEWGFHQQIVERNLSLHDFVVDKVSAELHNEQTRMLSGSDEPVTAIDALDRAKKNLDAHFVVAGLTERFDEFLLLCRMLLGWRNVFYQKKNINRHRPQLGEISPRTISVIEKHNSLDLELYDVVRQRFDQLILEYPTLKSELHQFQSLNRLYSFAGNLLDLPVNLIHDAQTAITRARMRKQRFSTP